MNQGIIYARVSTEEQAKEGQSIQTQVKLCRQYAQENNIHIINVFKDEGKSGTNTNRPALQAMLEQVIDKPSITHVLVLDTDRLARNTLDHLSIKSLLKKHDVQLISISQPMIDDSPEGNFIDTILASANALQSQITGRKTSKVMEQKAKAGWHPGVAAIGYQNSTNPSPTSNLDKRIITPHPSSAPLIKKMFKLYSTGNLNLNRLTQKMAQLNLKNKQNRSPSKSNIHHCLCNPIYYGQLRWKGKLHQGKHEPLVSKTLWDTCQTVMHQHNQHASRTRKHSYLLRGYLYCQDCQSRYWAGPHKGRNGIHHYYFCKKCRKGTYTDVKDLEKQVAKWFSKFQVSDKYIQGLKDTIKKVLSELRDSQGEERQLLTNQRTALETKMQTIEDKLIDDTLTKKQFHRIYDRLEKQLQEINLSLNTTYDEYVKKFKGLQEIISMTKNLRNTYLDADPALKRHYLNLFFDKIFIKDHKIHSAIPSKSIKAYIKNGLITVRVRKAWLASWNDFRTADWIQIVEYPELVMQQTQQFLYLVKN